MSKFRFFNKSETVGITVILLFLFLISLINFKASLRRSRDLQRRDDLTALAAGLEKFFNDFDMYPPASADGKIVACIPPGVTTKDIKKIVDGKPELNKKKIFAKLEGCEWGKTSLADVSDPSITPYLSVIPRDSRYEDGRSYVYFSTEKHFQIYGAYEGKNMPEFSPTIVARRLACGTSICNFGKASRGTPLDKSLQEYEQQLNEGK